MFFRPGPDIAYASKAGFWPGGQGPMAFGRLEGASSLLLAGGTL
jgi:hypothetical protein